MPSNLSYGSPVEARTGVADHILKTPELLAKYVAVGGLPADLEKILHAGLDAQAANQGQSTSAGTGTGATREALKAFRALKEEYGSVLGILIAVRHAQEEAGAAPALLAQIDQIITNEAELAARTVEIQIGEPPQKEERRELHRKVSHEAIRAEVEKDAGALVGLTEIHAALGERKVDKARLEKLQKDARALAGKLADRVAAKGSAKDATKAEHEAVGRQSKAWRAHYRLLAKVGRADGTVLKLLAEAAR